MPKYSETPDQAARRERDFTHHPPKDDQAQRYEANRAAAEAMAQILNANCPPSRELSLAMTNLDQVVFWGNAAIARNEH